MKKAEELKILKKIIDLRKENKREEIISLLEQIKNKSGILELVQANEYANQAHIKNDKEYCRKAIELIIKNESKIEKDKQWNFELATLYLKLNQKDIAKKFYKKSIKLGMNKNACQRALDICDGKAILTKIEKRILELPWEFTKEIYLDKEEFIKEATKKLQEKGVKWYPQDILIPEKMIMVCYEILDIEKETLLPNEKILSQGIEGLSLIYQVGVRLETENENGFETSELLRKIHNQLSGKNLKGEVILEYIENFENYKGVPIYYIARKEK